MGPCCKPGEKSSALTYEVCPRISLRALPDLMPCTRTSWGSGVRGGRRRGKQMFTS